MLNHLVLVIHAFSVAALLFVTAPAHVHARQNCTSSELVSEGFPVHLGLLGCTRNISQWCDPISGGALAGAPQNLRCTLGYCCSGGSFSNETVGGLKPDPWGPCPDMNNLSLREKEMTPAVGCQNYFNRVAAHPFQECTQVPWPTQCACTYAHSCRRIVSDWLNRNRPDPGKGISGLLKECRDGTYSAGPSGPTGVLSNDDLWQFTPKKHYPESSSRLRNLMGRISFLGIRSMRMIGKFQSTPPSWVDDRTSKLFGFADGFHDYDDNIRKYAKGSAPDSLDEVVDPKKWGKIGDEVDIKGSQELAPWKANSARVGYRLIHDPQTGPRISLMAYFYNDLERHLAEISQVKWGDCFVAEISIVDQVHVNQTFTRTKGTLIEPVTYQQTFPSGYVYKVWQLDPKGNLITQEIRAPRSVAQVGKATGQENWRPPTLYNALSQFVLLVNNPWNYYMGIALGLATPAWNGGWIVNLPFHGGSEKPQTDYKLWMKELERREYGAEESYQRMTSGGNTSGPTGSGRGITPGSPSCKTNCSTIPGQK